MKTLLSITIFCFVAMVTQAQAVHTVDNNANSGAQFTSVQDAIDAAEPGDFIYIHPSPNNYGNIYITKTIHIRGIGHHAELNPAESSTIAHIYFEAPQGAAGSTVEGLTLYAILWSGEYEEDYDNCSFVNCRINGYISAHNTANYADGWLFQGNLFKVNTYDMMNKSLQNNWICANNFFEQTTTSATWNLFKGFNSSDVFRNNVVATNQNNSSAAVTLYDTCTLTADNCIFLLQSTASNGITGTSSTLTYNNCLTYSYGGEELTALSGTNNLDNTNPMFLADSGGIWFYYSNDYHLDEASPATGAGTDGQDLGLYGNGIEFSMEGYPQDLPYPTKMVISTTLVNNGEMLEVQFKAKGN